MKKQYIKPKIQKHGTVQAITNEKIGSGMDVSHLFDTGEGG